MEPKYYFYRKNRKLFVISKNIGGKVTTFGGYKTEEIAQEVVQKLKDCGWDKSQLERIQSEVGAVGNFQREQTGRNYTYSPVKGFRVTKQFYNKLIHFGDYDTEEEAIAVTKELEKVNWDKSKLTDIKKKLGIEERIKNYLYDKKRGYWSVIHKNVRYGNYQTEEEAKIMVEELKKVNWDRKKIKDIWWDKQILGTINCKPKYYSYDKSRDQYAVKFGTTHIGRYATEEEAQAVVEKYKPRYLAGKLERKKKKKAKFYYKEYNRYRVRRTIDGEQLTFGSYADEETAKKVVEKLHEYDWNPDKLDLILKEIENE